MRSEHSSVGARRVAFAWFLAIAGACSSQSGHLDRTVQQGRETPSIDADGYFVLNGARTLLLGAEEPPVWVAFPELRPYPRIADDFARLCRDAGINLIVFYKWVPWPPAFIERLGQEGIWAGIQVAEAKQPLLSFGQTGGAIGTLPDAAFESEQMELIRERVSSYASLSNVAFWWIGGEFVEPFFYLDGGAALRALLGRYVGAIRSLDPDRRPITCSQHLLEALLCGPAMGRACLDLSDVVDFQWYTIATHMHVGDFVPGLPSSLNWQPVLNNLEEPLLLSSLLAKIRDTQGGKALYLGSWSTMSPKEGPCRPSAELTLGQWELLRSAGVPFSGGAFWNLGSHVQPSDFPHGLVELRDGAIAANENMIGLGQAYRATAHR
jgi:hypothetical protein